MHRQALEFLTCSGFEFIYYNLVVSAMSILIPDSLTIQLRMKWTLW